RPPAEPALRRRAAARGDRPRARGRAPRRARGRADRQPRQRDRERRHPAPRRPRRPARRDGDRRHPRRRPRRPRPEAPGDAGRPHRRRRRRGGPEPRLEALTPRLGTGCENAEVRSRTLLTSAAAVAIAAAGAGLGAGLDAALRPGATTTVVTQASAGAAAQPASAATGLTVNAIYRRTYQGVVDIKVDESGGIGFPPFGAAPSGQAEGSGFVYDKRGDIVTNEHVVSGASSILVTFWNGKTAKAKLVGSDDSTDLAVIRVSVPSSLLHPLTLGDSDAVHVGDPVIAIGSALGRSMQAPNQFTIADAIQTDAPINHGNSGGPLIDAAGQVIGVNSQIQSDTGGSDGVGFAIPSNTVRSVVSQIVAGKAVAHAYLGISVQPSLNPIGAGVARVLAGTPAARAGLKAGDVIVELGSAQIGGPDDLSAVIDGKKPGDRIRVTYIRGGKTHTVTVTLGTR